MTTATVNPVNNDGLNPVTTQTWTNGRHMVRCVKVIQETWDVRTFCFMAEQPVMFFFKPGQFVTLELEIEGVQVMRSYTISSSPSVPYSFSVTIKRVPGGQVSNWMHDNIEEGMMIPVHGPVGVFNCMDFPSDKVLLLSGGVGITPVMSMARWFFDTNAEVDMVFAHSARTPKDIIFRGELEHMCSRISNFELALICEKYDIGESWSGYRGYLNHTMLEMIAPDFMDREVFCCGPTPYMRAVKRLLEEAGFDMTRYHEESFGETPAEDVENAVESAEQAQEDLEALDNSDLITVEFTQTGKATKIAPGETVHAAAAKLGLHIPKACGMGICGTCKLPKTSGDVEMTHNGGITDEDVAEGFILTCCSVPQSDVTIDF
ncbi:hybrid-cluster NAD(P)-dependent oxidoreductase [Marinobacterium jannaschii]|uniref:hybrid-cluster NAD(P)-dependent oxidoreductase n=1 Tax=Marinobacterium jannaschii TaxID=64970 RepID=UPI00056210D1|nr:hybrid-cluster NAD(P)-dependent oxidoreductase [Marinobacterium jannaschii]